MRWIEEKAEFQEARGLARSCVTIDSGRWPTEKIKLYFQDLTALSDAFPPLLEELLAMSAEQSCLYMVLDPDPDYFWHDRLGKYPLFEFSRGDSTEEYFRFINQPFGDSPGDNMCYMWRSYAVFPDSLNWFVHTIRSSRDDTGHLWIPPEWKAELTPKHDFLWDAPISDCETTS